MSLIKFSKPILRGTLVLAAVIIITSLSVDATDTFRTSQSALGIFAHYATTPGCPAETVPVTVNGVSLCIDTYENSVGANCVIAEPASDIDTAANSNDADCVPVSKPGVLPWRYVSQVQAAQLCARTHKRLPTPLEWFTAAAGTPDGSENCNVAAAVTATGEKTLCRSGVGTFDMVGNVWEFVSGESVNGMLAEAVLPAEGYVQEITADGLPRLTALVPAPIYNSDYFWSNASGTFAIMRGGFYGSGSDGGVYSAHAAVAQSFSSAAAGFRCVTELSS